MYFYHMEKYNKRWWPYILLIVTFPAVNLSYRAFKITRAKTDEDLYNLSRSITKKFFSYFYIMIGIAFVLLAIFMYVYIEMEVGMEKE